MRLLQEAIHFRWRRDLSAYLDGYLEPPRREALDKHLAVCLLCQEEMAALRRVVALLRRVPQIEVPRSFALPEAPATAPRRPALYGKPLQYATAVAAVMLMAVVVGDLATNRTSGQSSAGPGVAATTTIPAAGALQDLAQATPSPQALPFAAAEKAMEPRDADASPSIAADEVGTLHKWIRGAEVVLGGLLAALVSVIAFQSWRGRRKRQG